MAALLEEDEEDREVLKMILGNILPDQ